MEKMKSRVFFADKKIEASFYKLKDSKTEDQSLYKHLVNTFAKLEENAFIGIHIPKRLIPKEHIQKYGIENLWKYNLPNGWRILYSVGKKEIMVITLILEWLPHKEYERRFKY